jgi:hypothetical protein
VRFLAQLRVAISSVVLFYSQRFHWASIFFFAMHHCSIHSVTNCALRIFLHSSNSTPLQPQLLRHTPTLTTCHAAPIPLHHTLWPNLLCCRRQFIYIYIYIYIINVYIYIYLSTERKLAQLYTFRPRSNQ